MVSKKIWLSAARKAVAKDPHTGGGELDHGGVYLKTQMIIEMRLLIYNVIHAFMAVNTAANLPFKFRVATPERVVNTD